MNPHSIMFSITHAHIRVYLMAMAKRSTVHLMTVGHWQGAAKNARLCPRRAPFEKKFLLTARSTPFHVQRTKQIDIPTTSEKDTACTSVWASWRCLCHELHVGEIIYKF